MSTVQAISASRSRLIVWRIFALQSPTIEYWSTTPLCSVTKSTPSRPLSPEPPMDRSIENSSAKNAPQNRSNASQSELVNSRRATSRRAVSGMARFYVLGPTAQADAATRPAHGRPGTATRAARAPETAATGAERYDDARGATVAADVVATVARAAVTAR